VKTVAVAVALAMLLSGCASSEGPLEGGRWFLSNPPDAGPLLWMARGVANMGLGAVYVGALAANFLTGLSSGKDRSLDPMTDPPPIFPPTVVGP
jgi:hypothetical protein